MKKNAAEIARRYATALVELAQEEGAIVDLLEEVRKVQTYTPVVMDVFTSPEYSDEERQALLATFAELLKLRPLMVRTLGLILKNRRFVLVPLVMHAYQEKVDGIMGICRATIASARPVEPGVIVEFEQALSKHLGKKVHLVPKVEEDLRAGYVLRVGNSIVDASLKTRLRTLRESMSRGV